MSVTIVLTVKGRPLHTLRWLFHADRVGMPFPILVADGGKDEIVERQLSNPGNYPRLNYRYLKYDDATLQDYWIKLADVVGKVETPYVMMSDNDDFVLPSTVALAAEHLDGEPDCVSAGGHVASFSLYGKDGVCGDVYNMMPKLGGLYTEADPFERLQGYLSRRFYLFYNVTRRDVLHSLFSETRDREFRNFDVWELFLYSSMIVMGKVRILPGLSYLRQSGTSQAHSSNQGWIRNILFNNWTRDFHSFVDAVDARAVTYGGQAPDRVGQFLRDHFARAYSDSADRGRAPAPAPLAGPFRDHLIKIAACRRALFSYRRHQIMQILAKAGVDEGCRKQIDREINEVLVSLVHPDLTRQIAMAEQRQC